MSMASPRSFGPLPVCSEAWGRLAVLPAGRAKRAGKAEDKIKETGTTSARFLKLLLSAHWLGEPRTALWFSARSAAIWRNALALLGFDRHHYPISGSFRQFGPESHP